MSASKNESTKREWNLTGPWAGAWKIFAGIGVLGLAASGAGYASDPRRFAFSWLNAFITVLTIALGALFFVLIQRLTSAGWSVTVRRTAEFFAVGLVVMAPLFIPVLASMNTLFPWLDGHKEEPAQHVVGSNDTGFQLIKPAFAQPPAQPHPGPPAEPVVAAPAGEPAPAATQDSTGAPGAPDEQTNEPRRGPHGNRPDADVSGVHGGGHGPGVAGHGHMPMAGDPHALIEKEILQRKSGYLNRNFFLVRVVIYFFVWIWISGRLFNLSTRQDRSKDPNLTLAAQRFAPPATMLFALSLTFAAFDWIMSLEPTWFSTIFGVVIFACGVVSSLAVIILVTLSLRNAGPLEGAVSIEHFHDLGKLMFGFLVFWAYVSFSQYMLIWYAALPEETTFFHNRWDHDPWSNVSMAIILFHFVVPFFWTMSRNFKRNVGRLQIGAAILLVMHCVDIYWFVMPNFHLGMDGFSFHWMDVTCLLAVGGIYGAYVFHRMTKFPLVPVGDPRLARALAFENA